MNTALRAELLNPGAALSVLDACRALVAGDKAYGYEISHFGESKPHLQAMAGAAMTRLISPLSALAKG